MTNENINTITETTNEMTNETTNEMTNETTNETTNEMTKSSSKSKAKPKAKPTSSKFFTNHQAQLKLAKSDEAVDVAAQKMINISSITAYDNPRNEPENLYNLGYTLIGDPKVEEFNEETGERVSLVHLALHEDLTFAQQYVELIEEFESVDRKEKPNVPQTIVELAADIAYYQQLYPIMVRKERNGYTGIDGGRRIAAILYLHAKSRVLLAKGKQDPYLFGDDGPKKVYHPIILATEHKATKDELKLLSIVANMSRKNFDPVQEGRIYHEILNSIDPSTGKPFTQKAAAKFLRVPSGVFIMREALVHPYDSKTGRGLTDTERRKVSNGEMLVTAASRKSLGHKHYTEGKPADGRKRALPLREIQRLFDESPENAIERRTALAECMGISYKEAVQESEERVKDQDRLDMERHDRKKKKGSAA